LAGATIGVVATIAVIYSGTDESLSAILVEK